MGMLARGKPRMIAIEATVTRADGTVEHLGVVSYWHANPIRRWAWAVRRWLRKQRGVGDAANPAR